MRFNSILVRLKVTLTEKIDRVIGVFQFHTGSIKSLQGTPNSIETDKAFQFHTGSIKRTAWEKKYPSVCSFQFHTGSIKSY